MKIDWSSPDTKLLVGVVVLTLLMVLMAWAFAEGYKAGHAAGSPVTTTEKPVFGRGN